MGLEQIQGIYNEVLFKEIANLHVAGDPYVKDVSEGFIFPRPLRDVIWRSGLRKGHETLGTVLYLLEAKKSGMALPLLRPMCEDVLFLLYIGKLPEAIANKIILLGAHREILQSVIAQSEGDPNVAWADIGITANEHAKESLEKVEKELVKAGSALGWRQGSYWPSVAHVAEKTGMKAIYNQIYHGTSRGVHFSPHHLMRMVWGKAGGPHTATLGNFERYYEAYALSNSAWLYCILITHCWEIADVEPEDTLNQQVGKMMDTLRDFGKVPIVTAEELMYKAPETPSA